MAKDQTTPARRFLIVQADDKIINLDSRLKFDVVYIHRRRRGRKEWLEDIAIIYGTHEVHLDSYEGEQFLNMLKRMHPSEL